MENQHTPKGNADASNGSPDSAIAREGQQEKEKSVYIDGRSDPSTNEADRAPDVLAFQTTLRKVWRGIKSQEFQGVTMAVATIAIAFFTAATWIVIRSGSEDTKTAAGAASSFAQTAALIHTDLQNAVTDNKNALADNKQAIEDTLKENRTELAAILAQNQSALKTSIDQGKQTLEAGLSESRLDQRPWVLPIDFSLSIEPEIDKEFKVKITMQNNGRTPGISVHVHSRLSLYPESAPPPPPILSRDFWTGRQCCKPRDCSAVCFQHYSS